MGGIGNAMERISMPSGGRRAYLSAQAGCAAAAMAQSPSNGDAMAIRRVGHELLLILSDGMGSGHCRAQGKPMRRGDVRRAYINRLWRGGRCAQHK